MWQRRMLDYAYGIGLYILCQIGLFDLAEHTFVERSVGFGLSRKFLITDRGFVQSERGFFLSARCSIEIALGSACLLQCISQDGWLPQDGPPQSIPCLRQRGPAGYHFRMFVLVTLREHGNACF